MVFGDAVIETIVGGVVSCTVTVNEPCATLPAASCALHCTVVVPSGKVDPDAGVHVTGTGPSKSSMAVAVNVTTAPEALVASAVMFDGGGGTVGGLVRENTTGGRLAGRLEPRRLTFDG